MSVTLDLRAAARPHMPSLEVPAGLRAAAIGTWHARMINEHGSAPVFEGLALQCEAAGLLDHAATMRTFAAEERMHGVLCGAVVEALGGEAIADVDAPTPIPAHDDASSPVEALLRNVISVSCMSETVAVALIGAERLEMPDGELRELLTRIWADEVGHSRFGWRLLGELVPTMGARERAGLDAYLEVALAHLVDHELRHLPDLGVPPEGANTVGVCDGGAARRLFFATVESAIVPGLARLGLAADHAWERARRVAPAA